MRSVVVIALTLAGWCWAAEPPESIALIVPEYTIQELGGLHYVTIPEGKLLMRDGQPRIPFYPVTVKYPAGCYVQEVTLTGKTGQRIETGIRLPEIEITADTTEATQPPRPAVTQGWYPDKDFDWRIWHDPQGGTNLVLSVYPLRYNSAVAEMEFHKEHHFRMGLIESGITAIGLSSDKTACPPGGQVLLRLQLLNTAEPRDITIKATVSGPVAVDLPVRNLRIPAGDTAIAIEWLTGSAPVGDYRIEVMVKDGQGNMVAREYLVVRVGIPGGEVISCTAEPSCFRIGDNIGFALEFRNTGSCQLSGAGVFRLLEGTAVIGESLYPYTDLAPGSSIALHSTWNTAQTEKGATYYLSAFVRYDGTTTPAQQIRLSTNRQPLAGFSSSPEEPSAGQEVSFDASVSADPDGTVSLYLWQFGDGAEARGVKARHRFELPGTYEVKLTVTDNEGGTGSLTQSLSVAE